MHDVFDRLNKKLVNSHKKECKCYACLNGPAEHNHPEKKASRSGSKASRGGSRDRVIGKKYATS